MRRREGWAYSPRLQHLAEFDFFAVRAEDREKAHAALPEEEKLYTGIQQRAALRAQQFKHSVYVRDVKRDMIDCAWGARGGLVFIRLNNDIFQLQKSDRLVRGLVFSAQGDREPKPLLKGDCLFKVIGRQANVLQARGVIRCHIHGYSSLPSTSISTFIVTSRFASMYS